MTEAPRVDFPSSRKDYQIKYVSMSSRARLFIDMQLALDLIVITTLMYGKELIKMTVYLQKAE